MTANFRGAGQRARATLALIGVNAPVCPEAVRSCDRRRLGSKASWLPANHKAGMSARIRYEAPACHGHQAKGGFFSSPRGRLRFRTIKDLWATSVPRPTESETSEGGVIG